MARITFQKRQKEMKRQEKRRMKDEKRAQRKMAKNAEPETAVQDSQDPSLPIFQSEESVAPMHKYVEADGVEKQMQAHSRETAVERWAENEGQQDGKQKIGS